MADTGLDLASPMKKLAVKVSKSSQTLQNIINGHCNSHRHVLTLSSDLEEFYLVLGTLEALLHDEQHYAGAVEHAMSEILSEALSDSIRLFERITIIIGGYQAPNRKSQPRLWPRVKCALQKKKIKGLRKEITRCMMALKIAICMAKE